MQDKYEEVAIILIAGTFLFLVLAGIMIFILLFYQKKRFNHRQQLFELQSSIRQELLRTQLETQEDTYRQIGEEIHDNIGQLLSTVKILLGITERRLADPPDSLRTATETVGKAIQDLRSLSKSLSKEWLSQFNIIDNLRAEIDRINAAGTIQTQLQLSVNSLPMRPEAQIMLFRVIQEAMQNVLKHAYAEKIFVGVSSSEDKVMVTIRDDGKGFPPDAASGSGMGLHHMENRTKLLGGRISWTSQAGQGAEVVIIVPIKTELV